MLRRLHHEQPASFAFTPANEAWAEAQISKYPEGRQASAIIPLLWRAQEQEGWLTRPAIEHVAEMLDMAYIRALEVGSPVTWVFTRNLVNDLSVDGEIYQAVKSNLSNGNRYVYFIPDVPSAYDIIDRYRKIHDYRPGQVAFHLIPESSFCFYTEVVVYNVDNAERIAIEWLPQASLNYFIAMDQAHTDHVSGIGKMFISKFPAFEIARA